ncbi:Pimeloyl-ACP methyl ester carboxylesterase [Tenacibaculum sp. 190130A14a]|uniref:Pimeloyl-ACP methyl ester carboxylesterase n=1 Tax=Tenacibaculum polynesiense TaxID=3137857 RepID=A0ABP1F0C9_9FLAO
MRLLKKIFKISTYIIFSLVIILYFLFRYYTSPKSDQTILDSYANSVIQPKLSKEKFKDFEYRKIEVVSDTTLPTIVFVHGTIGSLNDFNRFLTDSLLQKKANMIAYDRIGYNFNDQNKVQESIAFENAMLNTIISGLNPDKTILFGYSYGGPIALSIKQKLKGIILLAPAVYSKVEPMPWLVNFYKWKLTRWLVPDVWKEASKEKLSHKKDLTQFENQWNTTKSKVKSIHGNSDMIVPFSNSIFLQNQFTKSQFELIEVDDAGHGILWSNFAFLKQQLLNELD